MAGKARHIPQISHIAQIKGKSKGKACPRKDTKGHEIKVNAGKSR